METRTIWLRTLNGTPQGFSWALVKTPDEEPDPAAKIWAAALSEAQKPANGWGATTTTWKVLPPACGGGFFAVSTPTLADRLLTVAGLSFDLDTAGRTAAGSTRALSSDATIVDTTALVTAVEEAGEVLRFVEASTLKSIFVYPVEPASPLDGCAAAIYRQAVDRQIVRIDA